jgi:hypothetical protein
MDQPLIIRRMIRLLETLPPEKAAKIVEIGQFGAVEIHWTPKQINLFPRYRLATREDRGNPEADDNATT